MLILLIILAVAALVAAYVLFMPITVYANFQIDNMTTTISGIKVFPFEYRFEPGKPGISVKKIPKIKKQKPLKPEKPKAKLEYSKFTRDDLNTILNVFSNVIRLIGRLIKAPDQYFLHAALAGGLSEPDLTGQFFGAVQSIRPVLPNSVTISYNPDFLAEKINGKVNCGVVFRIFRLLLEIVIFILRLPLIKLYKLYKKSKRGG